MSEFRDERRDQTRIQLSLPVEVHQGGSVWHQQLIDLSLVGLSTDQPDIWDAQYNEPFKLVIHLQDGNQLELHAYLQHVESGRLGFSVQHVDRENIEPLQQLLEAHVEDPAIIEEERRRLDSAGQQSPSS